MSRQDYGDVEPMYEQAKREIPYMDSITLTAVQRQYRFGYNRAARLLEQLAKDGLLDRNPITGAYRRASTVNGDANG